MELDIPHSLALEEARARLQALCDYMQHRHGAQVTWIEQDRATIRGKYAVFAITAELRIEPGRVHVQGTDPGLALRAAAKKYVSGKLLFYLDPARAPDSLPRR